ncbi:hypothetical protein CHLRE_01g045400v5 [Chlamydomonas reinhardtii]|uniref:Cas12f1-like TNB domain-containing protein n=1 Tax=Chlamydomonas reinhardtii TaxID=3055 RepID=A0A2K3E7P8_CHLRE|nr:uncharacterized protein CHLRE_01g045400v5 [Chlamydomonas reinhardtii]PNW88808.1 hypothetical protein CHLRE_01g045400v5 [Chlamydomonas reinhardtii]
MATNAEKLQLVQSDLRKNADDRRKLRDVILGMETEKADCKRLWEEMASLNVDRDHLLEKKKKLEAAADGAPSTIAVPDADRRTCDQQAAAHSSPAPLRKSAVWWPASWWQSVAPLWQVRGDAEGSLWQRQQQEDPTAAAPTMPASGFGMYCVGLLLRLLRAFQASPTCKEFVELPAWSRLDACSAQLGASPLLLLMHLAAGLREVKGAQATYKKASTRHMEWAAEILAGLEARRDQLGAQVQQLTQAQPLTREDTQRLASLRRELHRARPFTLTPSPSFAPIYVPLDNTSMARLPGLLPTLARRHGEVFAGAGAGAVAPSSFVQAAFGGGGMQSSATLNAVGWGLFQLGGVTSRNAPFANYITTDGVACSVAREAHNKPLANLKPATAPADAEELLCTLEEMKATQIIGVDACGGGNWFMAARSPLYQPGPWAWEGVREGVSPAQRFLLELHDKQLDEELFPGQLPPEPRRRRKGAYVGGIPTAATASAARFEERLRYLFASGAAGQAAGQEAGQAEAAGPAETGPRGAVHVLWHYHFSAFRRKRWAAFIQRDRALHRVAKQLTGGRPKEEVVVGWGSWAFQGGKGGSPISVRGGRAPTGRLIKLLRERYAKHVFIIDEYKTSKTCYNCGCQEMAIKRLGGLKEGQRPWSVKVCNDCLTTWNRDVSAANVIRVLLLLKLMGFERPTKLQRSPWPAAAAGPG